ncbi:MAG: HAMP domain-containing protein [Deltaproteobacteria bacterium]|nr:HAMP domain-containing protein [Deltaproteobacteria bacterium]
MQASLRVRLRVGLSLLTLSLAVVVIASMASLNTLSSTIETLLRENYPSILACDEMSESLERQDSAAFFRASGREHVGFESIDALRRTFDLAIVRAEGSTVLPGEGEIVARVRALHRDYATAVDRALVEPPELRVAAYFRDVVPKFDRLKDAILELRRMNVAILERADQDARRRARRSVELFVGIGVVAALLAAWTAWWLGRAVVRPVDAFVRTATSIGDLDLGVSVPEPQVRELAPLAASFRRMLERLRDYHDRSQGELRAAQDLAKTTVECMLDPVIVFDERGGIRLANDAADTAFGLREGDGAVPREIAEARDRAFDSGAPVLPRSLGEAMRKATPEGERFYLLRAAPLRTAPGEVRSALLLAQDVTRYRRIDELKSDVVATVSHEFKTPLTSLRMATHMLLDQTAGPLTDTQREIVTTARDDTERLRRIVDELLDIVRIDAEAGALRMTRVEPIALLQTAAATHRALARDKGVTLEVGPAEAPQVTADRERLSIVLANLVSNAIRHTPSGGAVTLGAIADQGAVRFTVTDTGEGIEASELPRIFERSVRGRSDGHGLGLAIAREIVHEHGGELEVASSSGEGSVFTVILPASPEGS